MEMHKAPRQLRQFSVSYGVTFCDNLDLLVGLVL